MLLQLHLQWLRVIKIDQDWLSVALATDWFVVNHGQLNYKHNNEAPKVWTLGATKHYLAKYNLRPKEQAIY